MSRIVEKYFVCKPYPFHLSFPVIVGATSGIGQAYAEEVYNTFLTDSENYYWNCFLANFSWRGGI